MSSHLKIEIPVICLDQDDIKITPVNALIFEDFYQSEEDDVPVEIEIGFISASRFDLSFSPQDLSILADANDADLNSIAEFFLTLDNYPEIHFCRYFFYVDRVFIHPEYRGRGYALEALATFLDIVARGEVVSCHPQPMDDLKGKYRKIKGQKLMKRYWSKIGLTNYSKKHNVLWTEEWYMPEWLRKKFI